MNAITELSTSGMALKDRLGLWGETVWRHIGGLRSETFGDANFNGRIVVCDAGYLRICRLEATAHRVVRTPDLIRQSDQGYLKVVAQLQGRACFHQADREVWLSPGEWSVYDTTRSYTVTNPESVEQLVLMIPKSRLPDIVTDASLVVRCLSGRQGIGRLAWDTMLNLYRELPSMGDEAAAGMADVVTHLVHLSLVDLQGRTSQLSQREVLRDRIVSYIALQLSDPNLDGTRIARALNCSRRHLYNAFSEEPEGIAGLVLKQRLLQARQALDDPRNAWRTLGDIAYDCGFNRPAQFSQAFRARFGMTPSEYRAGRQEQRCAMPT